MMAKPLIHTDKSINDKIYHFDKHRAKFAAFPHTHLQLESCLIESRVAKISSTWFNSHIAHAHICKFTQTKLLYCVASESKQGIHESNLINSLCT
jgi:hypothetical protein